MPQAQPRFIYSTLNRKLKKGEKVKKLIMLTALLFLGAVLGAQFFVSWTGVQDTNWHNAANWSNGLVPTDRNNVTISSAVPNFPVVSNSDGECGNLQLNSGAQLTLNGQNLYARGSMKVKGKIIINTGHMLESRGAITWESGSTVAINHSRASIVTRSHATFESGSNVKFANGSFRMISGTLEADRNLINQSRFTEFYDLMLDVQAPYKVIFSSESTYDFLVKNDFYNGSLGTTNTQCGFEYDGKLIVRKEFVNRNPNGGLDWNTGTLEMAGSGSQAIIPTGVTRLNNLFIQSSGTVEILDDLECNGNVRIYEGVLNLGGITLSVNGDWSNYAGPSGLEAGSSTVRFVNDSEIQYYDGEGQFNILEMDKAIGALAVVNGGTLTCNVYNVVDGAIAAMNGTFNANDLANNAMAGGWYCYDGGIINVYNPPPGDWIDLKGHIHMGGGQINVYGGSTAAYWPFAAGAFVEIQGGVLDFKDQGIYFNSAAFNDFHITMTGGTIRTAGNVYGYGLEFQGNGGTLELYGGENAYLEFYNSTVLPNLLINKSGGSGAPGYANRVFVASDLRCKNLEIQNGEMYLDGPVDEGVFVTVSGDFTNYGNCVTGPDGGQLYGHGDLKFKTGSYSSFGLGAIVTLGDFLVEPNAEVDFGEDFTTHLNGQGTHRITIQDDDFGFSHLTVGGPNRNAHYKLSNQSSSDLVINNNLRIINDCSLGFENNATKNIHVKEDMHLYGTLNVGPSKFIIDNKPYLSSYGTLNINPDGEFICYDFSMPRSTKVYGTVNIDGGILRFENRSVEFMESSSVEMNQGLLICDSITASYPNTFQPSSGTVLINDEYGNASPGIYVGNDNWLPNLVLDSNTGIWLLGDLEVKGDIDVDRGIFKTSGKTLTCGGDINVGDGGLLMLEPGTTVDFKGSPHSKLRIHSGGRLESLGTDAQRITIANSVDWMEYSVLDGGSVAAEYTNFRHGTLDGFYVHNGAIVDEEHSFHNCAFEYSMGTEGSCLLRIENDQILTVKNAEFNRWPDANNARKSGNKGIVHFINATGTSHGEQYENDPHDRIFWSQNSNPQQPDLVVLKAEYSQPTAMVGDIVQCVLTYANTGEVDVDHFFFIGLYQNRSTPPVFGDYGNLYGTIAELAAVSTQQHVFEVSSQTVGLWNSYVQIDSDNYITESNENNNVYGPFQINWEPLVVPPVTNVRIEKALGMWGLLMWDYEGVCTRFKIYGSDDPYFTPHSSNLLGTVNYPGSYYMVNSYMNNESRKFFIVVAERDVEEAQKMENNQPNLPPRRGN